MKVVAVSRDFSYRAKRHVFVQYLAGVTYQRVPEAAVRAILEAGAGRVVPEQEVSDVRS
ncbi:MAG: hypothetical protein J0H42_04195 [Rhizobiales bacterium]|nr:hypothetical protein [Hyphomicrobiales bacterium]